MNVRTANPAPGSPISRACDADRRRCEPSTTDEAIYIDRDGSVRINYTLVQRLRAEREPRIDQLIAERESP